MDTRVTAIMKGMERQFPKE